MRHRSLSFITLTCIVLAAGCGDEHKSDDSTTHGASHSAGDTAGSTAGEPTSGGAASSGTAAAVEPPAAPTDLVLSILEGGVHSTWKDASDNEDNFILEKKAAGDADFAVVIELPFDSVTYHDIDVTVMTMYTYRVKAVNAGGESVSSEAMIQVP